jgi:Fe-S cluster assembly protein SufD
MMNIDMLSTLVEEKIKTTEKSLNDFTTSHLNEFKKKGFKEVTLDSYKFTPLNSFFEKLNNKEEFTGKIPHESFNFPTITFIDGKWVNSDPLPQGVTVKKMKDHFEVVKPYLTENNALSHLHHALFEEGVFLEVAKNEEIKTPLCLVHYQTKPGISALTHLVVAHPHSKITLIEETRALGNASQGVISETYLKALPNSKVEHICLDLQNGSCMNHHSVLAEIEQNAEVRSVVFHGSGLMNRKNLTLNLNAPGSHGESFSLYLTKEGEHSDIFTEINHKSPDTTSRQISKGILDGDSKGIFTGKIHIYPKAQRVNSSQLNKNLLLSKKAQVHSQPQLEIFADDVKCSHGSTTGQLSPDEVFYLEARGIPKERARNLLALGHGMEIVQNIQNEKGRLYISGIIRDLLSLKFSLKGSP